MENLQDVYVRVSSSRRSMNIEHVEHSNAICICSLCLSCT